MDFPALSRLAGPHLSALRAQQPGVTPEQAHQELRRIRELKGLKLWQVKGLMKGTGPNQASVAHTSSNRSSRSQSFSNPATRCGPKRLSTRALSLLSTSLYLHERSFLQVLPNLYPPLRTQADNGGDIAQQALRFEVVAFAAGLKSAVLFGWGDGSSPNDHRVGQQWTERVWNEGVLGDFCGEHGAVLGDRDAAAGELSAFLNSVRFEILGDVVTELGFVHTGHYLLHHQSSSPHTDNLLRQSKQPGFNFVPESLFSTILDYPVSHPPDRIPADTRDVLITLGEQSRDSTFHGTDYRALHPRDDLAVQSHFEKYKLRLAGALFGAVEICWDGHWYGDVKNTGARKNLMTREEAVKTATEELVKLMDPLQGLNKLEGMRRVKGDSWSFKSLRDMLRM